jgi:hypothetical protein
MADLIIPGRILGIFWTTASWSSVENSVQITNQNYEIVNEVQNYLAKLGFEYTIYQGPADEKRPGYEYDYYRMKIYNKDFIHLLRKKYNWRGRREEKRYYPNFNFYQQEVEFLRYYISSQHYCVEISVNWGQGKQKRLKIFVNKNFADILNKRVSDIVGVGENKVHKHHQSDVMMYLFYQSKNDVSLILDFISSV